MKKEYFEIIETNLKTRIEQCSQKLDHILTTEDLKNITIKEFLELKSFCKQEQIDMTEILMVDLYHVLGMGKLTLQQRNTFLSLINKYATYRSDMKCIATMSDMENLPKLPSRSKYKLHKLGEVTLHSTQRGARDSQEILDDSETSITDYHQAKIDDKSLPMVCDSISLEGNFITLDVNDCDKILPALAKCTKLENLMKAALTKTSYCNIIWEYTDETHSRLKGTITNNNSVQSLRDKLRNLGAIV